MLLLLIIKICRLYAYCLTVHFWTLRLNRLHYALVLPKLCSFCEGEEIKNLHINLIAHTSRPLR